MYADKRPFKPPADGSAETVASLIVWIREKPGLHCSMAGELDSVLWYLHTAWARLANRESNFQVALEEIGIKPQGLLSEEEQSQTVHSDDEATKSVLRFWAVVGSILGIEKQTTSWPDAMSSKRRGQ